MVGQVKFWISGTGWGLARDPETNKEYHVHISDVADRITLDRNTWVRFDIASRKGKGTSAINVIPIDCPQQYLLRGTVIRYVENQGFGFIRYGRAQLPANLLTARPKRLRFLIFHTPGRLVHHARQLSLRLGTAIAELALCLDAVRFLPLPA